MLARVASGRRGMTAIDLNGCAPQGGMRTPCASAAAVLDAMSRRMQQADLGRPSIEADGTLHRFALPEERGGKTSGWYVAYTDGIACGVFGSWKSGFMEKITALDEDLARNAPVRLIAEAERIAMAERLAAVAAEREAERLAASAAAREMSMALYNQAGPVASDHPYLRAKGLTSAPGARQSADGELLIPLYDGNGQLAGVQRIATDGTKRFVLGFAKKGAFGWLEGDTATVLVCEGYATGCSLNAATGCAVAVALDAGNLLSVTPVIRSRFPQARLVVCADNDQWTRIHGELRNVGVEKANQAAALVNATVVCPRFRDLTGNPTDFNDLAQREGLEEVRWQVLPPDGVPYMAKWSMDMFSDKAEPQQWLVQGTLPLAAPCLLAAAGGTGKGMLALDLGLRVAAPQNGINLNPEADDNWLGASISAHGTVVILTAEDTKDDIHRRLEALDPDGSRRQAARGHMFVVPLPNTGGPLTFVKAKPGWQQGYETTPAYEAIARQLENMPGLKLVNIDPLASFVAVDINADPQAGQFVHGVLAQLAERTGATVLVAHHMGKGLGNSKGRMDAESARNAIRGSTALVDGVRLALAVWPADDSVINDIEKAVGHSCDKQDMFCAAVVKANCQADNSVRPLLRHSSGVLRAIKVEFTGEITKSLALEMLRTAIQEQAAKGCPFTQSGSTGIHKRKDELPSPLNAYGRNKLEQMTIELLENGSVVRCTYGKSVGRYLDVPGGQFAEGNGVIETGSTADRDQNSNLNLPRG